MAIKPRHGFGLLHASAPSPGSALGQDGAVAGVLPYCQLSLNLLPRRGKKRLPAHIKQLQAAAPV